MRNLFFLFISVLISSQLLFAQISALRDAESAAKKQFNSATSAPLREAPQTQVITPEFLWKLGRVSDPRLSPDGKEALYNIRTFDLKLNKGNSDIWKVNVQTSAAAHLTTDSANETSARWSADGKKIFYLSDKGGSSQLWSMNADGSNQVKETNFDNDINAFAISADGSMIWIGQDIKIDKAARDLYPDLPKTTGRIYDDLMYRHWDTWADGTYSHILVAKFDNGKIIGLPKDIMNGERYDCPLKPFGGDEQISWRPGGKMFAYTCKKLVGKEYAVSTNSDIYLYDVTTNETTNLTEGMKGYDVDPQFSADGTKLIWRSQQEDGVESDRWRLFIYDFKTKEKKELSTGFDYDIEMVSFNKKGDMIYAIAGVKARENIFSISLVSDDTKALNTGWGTLGIISQITNDVADYTELSVSSDGKKDVIVASRMSMLEPTELFTIHPSNLEKSRGEEEVKATQLTFTNKELLSTVKQATVQERQIKSTDGKDILTWIIYPPDFNPAKKYPTLLYCQGGPQSVVSQFFSYRWNFR